jgi:uncharacterized protein YceK
MKEMTIVALLGAALLSGCASTRQDAGVSQAANSTASTTASTAPSTSASTEPRQQPVAIPAVSAKKLVLSMTGPKTVTEAKDWSSFKEEWRATFADHAKDAGIAFSFQDGAARPAGETGTHLAVHVDDYRMVGIGARVFFGAMSGTAYIDAKAAYHDLKTGNAFGRQSYNTSSSGWQGVFGKATPQQVDAIATEVFRELKAAR